VSLTSVAFFLLVAITVVAFHLNASVPYRRFVLGTANAVFLASYVSTPLQLVPLLAFLGLGYAVFQGVRRWPKPSMVAIGIVMILAVYIVLKRFSFIEPIIGLPFAYLTLGLSYILFRTLQLVIDRRSDNAGLDNIDIFAFFRFTCNFLTFVSGPIQRLDADRTYQAFSRFVAGYAKFMVIAELAKYVLSNISAILLTTAPLAFQKLVLFHALCAVAYTIYLYFNFSGYMDIVIGIGLLLGQRLPENFNNPFAARSFLEFWQRWHMTLSNWFRTYLFNPLLMGLMVAFPAPSMTAVLGVVAFFVTFLVMGIWHGTTLVCVVYGLLMGAGASINKIWQIVCTSRLGKKRYRTLAQTTAYIYAARGLTVAYFAQTLTYLWVPDFAQFTDFARRLGASGECATYLLLASSFALLSFAYDGIAWLVGEGRAFRAAMDSVTIRNMYLSSQIIAILAISSLFSKPPEFVYRAF
jgi:alginate O-acetyltransferase complex protein AlgI